MMKITRMLLLTVVTLMASATGQTPAEHPAHQELRALRTEVVAAIDKGDIDAILTHLHPDVVITWQNGVVCKGRDGTRDFFERMGKNAFRGYKQPPTPAELTILHGDDSGVSYGTSVGQFELLGKSFEFTNHWTAQVVKVDGKWLLASYHVSWNALDNPLLDGSKRLIYGIAPLALIAGMLLGAWLVKRRARKA